MATNFFWIGYLFDEFRSQVAIRKKNQFHTLNLLLDQLIIPKLIFFFILITYLVDIALKL